MAPFEDCDAGSCSQSYLTYEPSLPATAVFCGLFGLLVLLAIGLGARYRGLLFATFVSIGLGLETAGYIGRILLSTDAFRRKHFALFFLGTVIGPNFLSCALFLCVPNIVYIFGPDFQTWTPPWYHIVFFGLSAASLVIEIVGGVLATTLDDDVDQIRLGVQLVAVGLAILLVALAVFVAHATLLALALRTREHGLSMEYSFLYSSRKFKTLLFTLTTATFLIILRSTFRVISVVEGFTGHDDRSEIEFLLLDAAMISVAAILILIMFPPRILGETWFNFAAARPSIAISAPSQVTHYDGLSPGYHNMTSVTKNTYPYYNGRLPPPPPRPPVAPPGSIPPAPPPKDSSDKSPAYTTEHQTVEQSRGSFANFSRKPTSMSYGDAAPAPAAAATPAANPRPLRDHPNRHLVTSEALW